MKKVLPILLAIVTMSCTDPVIDTFGNISGTVQDAKTVTPLPGVKVALTPTGYSQLTGTDGAFQFDNLDVQEYTLTFSKDGYQAHQQKVSVKPGLSSSVQVSLTPMSGSLEVTPSSLSFGTTATSQQLQLRNKAASPVIFTAETSSSWITVSSASGTVKQSDYITVLVSRNALSPGDYSGEVIFRYSGETLSIPVTMTVVASGAPSVRIENYSNVTSSSATVSANLVSIGTSGVSRMGICWSSTNQIPTLSDFFSNQGDASGPRSFSANLTNLAPATTYYCRAYARNSSGVSYSDNSISFTTASNSGGGDNPGGIAVRQGLMAYYTFDNSDASDSHEMELDGQVVNNPNFITDTPSGKGKALFLNGTKGQYVSVSYNLFKGLDHYSIALWLKDFSGGSVVGGVSNNEVYSIPRLYLNSDGYVLFECSYSYLSNSASFAYKYTSIQSGKWHHIVATYANGTNGTNGTKKIYIDGVLVDSMTGTVKNPESVTKIYFGGNSDGQYPLFFTGKIDNVRIYSRDLSETDAKNIYDAEKQ